MTEKMQVWKCDICGNVVEILSSSASNRHGPTGPDDSGDSRKGDGILVCCGQPMRLMVENSVDAAVEKHKPIIEGGVVKVGSILHPMSEEHYIEWIEGVGEDGVVAKKFLKSGDEPVVEFCFNVVSARGYCNLHGLWK